MLLVKVQSDDTVVLGKNDFDHVQNLKAVLDILKENGWRLKMKKCIFMQSGVIYSGFKIHTEGICPVLETRMILVKKAQESFLDGLRIVWKKKKFFLLVFFTEKVYIKLFFQISSTFSVVTICWVLMTEVIPLECPICNSSITKIQLFKVEYF